MTANPDMSPHTRAILMQLRSDGFEAHHIVTNTKFNNLQLFTQTMRAPEPREPSITHGHLPCASKKSHTWYFHPSPSGDIFSPACIKELLGERETTS